MSINISHWFSNFKLLSVSFTNPVLVSFQRIEHHREASMGRIREPKGPGVHSQLQPSRWKLRSCLSMSENWVCFLLHGHKRELQLTTTTGSYFLLLKEPTVLLTTCCRFKVGILCLCVCLCKRINTCGAHSVFQVHFLEWIQQWTN